MFRRSSQDAPADAVTLEKPDAAERPDAQAPKGRPTPKRSEAEANRRGRAYVPKDRKVAAKDARSRDRSARERQRAALLNGDESALPPRDKGPVRRFCRDYVDSRMTAAEWFLPFAVIILLLSVMRSPALTAISLVLWVVIIVLIVVHSFVLAFGLRKQLAQRFPDKNTKGAVAYTLMRTLQMRRLRLPKPQVKRGQKP
ncbi:DUF3043 domain-containing protein [Streptacidiphilus carbonis]|uniref:DUF3043 domain-containing protein n=1 Tax=Streptacidiphilus carbonis TaxID=105422 RepID=UPI0005A92EEA|nr:DUF3043 domain-containing protein [Streptacidiphilus carbonis]